MYYPDLLAKLMEVRQSNLIIRAGFQMTGLQVETLLINLTASGTRTDRYTHQMKPISDIGFICSNDKLSRLSFTSAEALS